MVQQVQAANKVKTPFRTRLKRDLRAQCRLAREHRVHYLLMLPYALVFFLFTVLPVIISIYLSFTYFNVLEPPRFIGLQNYFKLFFNDDLFLTAIRNTLVFAAITGPVSYFLCLMLAWLINELPAKPRAVLTLMFYAPSISGGMYMIWSLLFSGDSHGFINGFLLDMGLITKPIQFLKDEATINTVIIIVVLWMSLGASFLSFIAGLQGIDKQYYDAAAIDGVRNRWQELWFVTLPLMKPQLMFGAILSITGSFGIGDTIPTWWDIPAPTTWR